MYRFRIHRDARLACAADKLRNSCGAKEIEKYKWAFMTFHTCHRCNVALMHLVPNHLKAPVHPNLQRTYLRWYLTSRSRTPGFPAACSFLYSSACSSLSFITIPKRSGALPAGITAEGCVMSVEAWAGAGDGAAILIKRNGFKETGRAGNTPTYGNTAIK